MQLKYRSFFRKKHILPTIFFVTLLLFAVISAQAITTEKINVIRIITEDYDGVKLAHPSKLFHDSFKQETYVIDSGNNRILIYAHDFFPLMTIDKSDGIENPLATALDSAGNLFIAQSSTRKYPKGRLSKLNASFKWEKDIVFEGFDGADKFLPRNIAVNKDGLLYVVGSNYSGVVVIDKNGIFSHILTAVDSVDEAPVNAKISDIAIDNHNNIYLLSEEFGRIYVYDAMEKFLFKFGQKGGSSGKMSRPKGITIDNHSKRIFIVDYMRHTILTYNTEGKFLFEFGGLGWSKGWLQYPSDVCIDRSGHLLVADTFNNRVQVFKTKTTAQSKSAPIAIKKQARKKIIEQMPSKDYILKTNMNLREKNSVNSKIVQLVKKGEQFQILKQNKQDELTCWHFIKTKSGQTGWICGIYRGKTMFSEK